MTDVVEYLIRISPAFVLVALLYGLLRGPKALPLRIMLVILGFLVIRDTMVVFGYWHYGVTSNWIPWLRFIEDPLLVACFAVGSLLMTAVLVVVEREGRKLLVWGKPKLSHLAWGVAGGIAIALPLLAAYRLVPLADRGGALPTAMIGPMLLVAAFGNLTEDVLMRGYVQGYLATLYSPLRAALGCAMFYAAGHLFLVTTVTDLGLPILVLALYDGLVCALVRMKSGIIPAAISHGVAICVLGLGLL
ncbi:MAG TPA: CPBP family glutamic-type intramembrane protease [Micromonosporaceae bacterium]